LSSQVLQTTYISDRYFYLIGVLPSLEREECKKIIESYGGRVTTAVSGKTDYLLAGRDVGKTKTDKADKLRVKIISEDNLLDMIRTRPGTKDTTTKSPSTKTSKPTVLKPIENTSFVSISSPKLKVYKQDDGILCKLHREIVFQIFILCKNRG
jgi:BRCT domain type II-containing protein